MMRTLFVLAFVVISALDAVGQVNLESGLLFIDKTSAKGQLWQVNGSAAESQGFLFPSAIGSVGQVVKVASVSSGSATFSWTTPTGSLAGLSSITTADVNDNTSWAQGPGIAIVANTSYRIVGELAVYRDAGGGASDAVLVGLRDMPSSTYAQFSVECIDCPAGTTGAPASATGTGTDVQLGSAVNPGGATDYVGVANTFHYRLEGLVRPTANGSVYFGFNKSTGSNLTKLVAGSYWAVIPIE
ncbi:MAG: hypothetical protein ACK5GI_02610 [Ignavibacteria bacterium]|jgi:hypothetical protein